VGLDESGYRGLVLQKLTEGKARIGDTIEIRQNNAFYSGVLMPRSQIGSDPTHVVIKLDSGYNIGVKLNTDCTIKRVGASKRKRGPTHDAFEPADGLPTVAILSTGGTIASKVDYRTGAVNPALSAKDLYDAVPELRTHANVRAKILLSKLSENISTSDWTRIARGVAAEIKAGAEGVVVAHGTDTLGFTAAALAFALQSLPVPVVLVGSQRSSDRPSSDAAMNLIGATDLAARADAAEVMVAMHGETGDSFLHAHRGTKVRKLHTSRRDAFRSVNAEPLFKVQGTSILELSPPLLRRQKGRKLILKPRFEEKVALLKTYPGIDGELISGLIDGEYKGIVLEGTGLGHAPTTIVASLKQASDAGLLLAMTSQCVFGRVDMNVYRTGVELLDLGVIPCEDMIPETALVKMMWVLANTKSLDKAREMLHSPLAGEFDMRTEYSEYPAMGGE
jgi:glutamyl-tRNA(Gln) amidotransferase subunit D